MRKGIALEDFPDADLPDAAALLLATRLLNQFSGAAYTCEEVAAMDPIIFDVIEALNQGLRGKDV